MARYATGVTRPTHEEIEAWGKTGNTGALKLTAARLLTQLELQEGELEHAEARETLRDRFAMAALTGIVGAETLDGRLRNEAEARDPTSLAEDAYCIADAMMAARDGEDTEGADDV